MRTLFTLVVLLTTLCVASQAAASDDVRRQTFAELQSLIAEVSRAVLPSVVHVEAIVRKNNQRAQVTGSGFFLDTEGYVVTNEHVVADAERVEVMVQGHAGRLPAVVVGTDKLTDLALLKVELGALAVTAARLGDDTELSVGQWVLAVGNPYGLDGTVSFGIVSAKGRNLEAEGLINEFIQTDAMIDFGSSGGPLVDLDGRVVGVNSMGQGRGIGFTIPISTVKDVVARIKAGGVQRGWLGVVVQPLSRDLAEHLGFASTSGVVVVQVLPGSPAADAGIRVGDILTRFGPYALAAEDESELNEFRRIVAAMPVGERVDVVLLRDGRERTLQVRVGEQPKVEGERFETEYGFHVEEITTAQALRFRLARSDGVMVAWVERGSPAAEAGLQQGDVILSVEGREIGSLAAFADALAAVAERPRFLLRVLRGDAVYLSLVRPLSNGERR